MKKILLVITISIITLVTFLILPKYNTEAESLCPSNMDPNSRECLDYLRTKLSDAKKQEATLSKKLADEQYKQLSLQEKIDYINAQITQTEAVINTLHMEIMTRDVEINIFQKEIGEKEDNLSILKQEINLLKETVNKRVTESYKYSYVGFLELLMDVKNIDTVLRKTKYLIETREKDRSSLEEYAKRVDDLKEEEELLEQQKAELQAKRNEVEVEKTKLVTERNNLANQKSERESLLAESKKKGEQILSQLDANRARDSALENEIMEYLSKHGESMVDAGWVTKGTWIGYVREGSNSCSGSTGTHLHFAIDYMNTSYWDGCGKVSVFDGGYLIKGSDYYSKSGSWYYYYIRSGSMRVPLGGSVILTGLTHSGSSTCPSPRYAIDIVSTMWTNIPVYAAMDGNLKKGNYCGEKYAVIENPSTGIRTAYFHMRQ